MRIAFETLARDLRICLRGLIRRPALVITCALTLAIGLAGHMTVFSVLGALLLRPHPFPELERLVLVREIRAGSSGERPRLTPGDFLDLAHESRSFQEVAAFRYAELNLGGDGTPESVRGYYVTPSLFSVLGVEPERGRAFSGDEGEGGARVAVLSHAFEKRRFGEQLSRVGREIVLNGIAHTVIGVMPEGFNYPRAADVLIPLALTARERVERGTPSLFVVARLAPGVSPEAASDDLEVFGRSLAERYPESHRERGFRLLKLREEQYEYTFPMFSVLQIASALVLLLAAANVSNLVLVWRMAGRREGAIRWALGAGRAALLRQSLLECLALTSVAFVLAVPMTFWAVELVRDSMPQGIATFVSGWRDIRLEQNALGLGLLTAFVVALGMSGAGARPSGGRSFLATLQAEGRRGTTGGGKARLRAFLAGAQIALALLLLSGAVWLLRGFEHQMNVFSTLEPRGVLTARIGLSRERFPADGDLQSYFERAVAVASELPGVENAAAAANLPASNVPNEEVLFTIEGQRPETEAEMPRADFLPVAGAYFELFRIPLLRGRYLQSSDDADAPRVVVASETWVRRHLDGGDPLGGRVRLGPRDAEGPWWTIVGVVSDVKQNWFDPEARPMLYVSHLQSARPRMRLAVRSGVEGYDLAGPLREKLATVDRDQALAEPKTLSDEISESLAPLRIVGILLLFFAAAALLLATTGVYGVVATAVAERTREVGLRMALGALPSQVLRQILRETLNLAAFAVAVALPAAFGLNVVLAGRLFGIVVVSPLMLAALGVCLLGVALAAAFIPARTATRLDPVHALRRD